MAVQFQVYTDVAIEDYMMNHYGISDYTVLSMYATTYSENVTYTVLAFENSVVNTNYRNFAFFDDYRPGVDAVVHCPKGFITVGVSLETTGNFAKVDAPVEIIDQYKAMLEYNRRRAMVEEKLRTRQKFIEHSRMMGFDNYQVAVRLHNGMSVNYYEAVKLVKSFINGKLRSEFRASLAAQIFNWLNDPAPKYKSPLSPKQIGFLTPYKPY